ncbi:unnamed protein product [Calypogeia fissa]
MSGLKAMPCLSNGKVVILSCLTRPHLPTHTPICLSTLCGGNPPRISNQIGRIPARNFRWRSCCGAAFKGSSSSKKRSYSSSNYHWGSSGSFRVDWGLSKLRTSASSPQGNDNSTGSSEDEVQFDVQKILRKGFLVEKAEELEEEYDKPEICTADELHYVAVPGTTWRLALWRYRPPPNAPQRNHPVLMLSGIGTNAIGFDLDPSVSMARSIAAAGFDTWILEVRGSGLSKSEQELSDEGKAAETSNGALVENVSEHDKGDSSTNESSNPTSVDNRPATFGLSQPAIEEGTASKMDTLSKTSNESSIEDMALVDTLDDLGKKSKEPTNGSMTDSDPDANANAKANQKLEGGTASLETWSSATELSNFILKMSNNLSNLLSQGQSKILSARFIDSFVNLLEENAVSRRITELRERLASLLEAQENNGSSVMNEIADLRKKLAQVLEDGQDVVRPRVTDLQERLSNTVDDFQKIVDLIAKYDWDFDDYLDEDVPTAMEYVRNQCKPVDGKLLSVGHSMGGIVLYAMMSKMGNECGLVGAVALASALDYQCSDSSLKLLLPLANPAQVLNVPVVPLGALMTAVHPLVTRPPYALAWLGYQMSARNMMKPELFSKLVLNNFGTIPVKLLLHLSTVFQPGGLATRDGSFKYKQNIGKVTIPVLAIAGDRDLICPPVAVLDTVHLFPKDTVTYKCFGGENNRHYAHYDIVCSPAAKEEVFPVVLDFLLQNDTLKMQDKEKVEVEV